MGRLPASFANKVIQSRVPYELSGELVVATTSPVQFPEATFLNSVDKPFEIHRMIPRVYALDAAGLLVDEQPDQELLAGLVRLRITDLGLDQVMTKNPTLIGILTKGSSERTWEWAEPHTLVRSNQMQVVVELLAFPAGFAEEILSLKVAIAFEGFLLVLAPASENR